MHIGTTGPSGAKLIDYEWKWTYGVDSRGEDRRESDWTQAEECQWPGCGRKIVHVFHVAMPNGDTLLLGSEHVNEALGLRRAMSPGDIKHFTTGYLNALARQKYYVDTIAKRIQATPLEAWREWKSGNPLWPDDKALGWIVVMGDERGYVCIVNDHDMLDAAIALGMMPYAVGPHLRHNAEYFGCGVAEQPEPPGWYVVDCADWTGQLYE